MKYYYGYIVDSYGFIDENDERRKPEFIEVSEELYRQLFDDQVQGLEIVSYNNKVFTAPRGLYYVGEDREWHKKDDQEFNRETLENTKNNKYIENDKKAKAARYNQEFVVNIQGNDCIFDTSQTTQEDLLTAFAVCSTGITYDGWVTNNGITLDLTMEDLILISTVFKEKSDVYGKWNEFKTRIDRATTVEEVNAIIIDYSQDIED